MTNVSAPVAKRDLTFDSCGILVGLHREPIADTNLSPLKYNQLEIDKDGRPRLARDGRLVHKTEVAAIQFDCEGNHQKFGCENLVAKPDKSTGTMEQLDDIISQPNMMETLIVPMWHDIMVTNGHPF